MSIVSGGGSNARKLAAEWRERISKIARNLTDFNDSEVCVRVKSRMNDPRASFSGRTAIAAREAFGALDGLWQDYLLLSRVVDDAGALARKSRILSNHDAEVVAMLTGPSIKLPVVSVPVRQRGLLDDPERQGTAEPRAVLESMIKAFDVARSTVGAIDEADSALRARTDALRAAINDLKNWSSAQGVDLGEPSVPAIDSLESDPLDALDQITIAEKDIEALMARRAALAAELSAIDAALEEAGASLDELRGAIEEAKKRVAECAAAFQGVVPVLDSSTEKRVDELQNWLETLRATRKANRTKASRIGLAKWNEAFATCRDAARATTDACRQMATAREDLAGRLRALRAKGKALATTHALPQNVFTLENEAKTEVRRTPYRPADAEAAVKTYEHALAVMTRKS